MNEFVGSSFPLLSLLFGAFGVSFHRGPESGVGTYFRLCVSFEWCASHIFFASSVRLLEPRVLLTYHISRVEYISYLRSSYCYVEPNTTITKTTQHKNTQQQQPTILCFMDNML
jgi:hypothetical protein